MKRQMIFLIVASVSWVNLWACEGDVLGMGSSTEYSRCHRDPQQVEVAKSLAMQDAKKQCGAAVQLCSDWKISGRFGCWDEGTIYAEAYFACVGRDL